MADYILRDNNTGYFLRNLPGARWNDSTVDTLKLWRFANPEKGAGPRAIEQLKAKGYDNLEFVFCKVEDEDKLVIPEKPTVVINASTGDAKVKMTEPKKADQPEKAKKTRKAKEVAPKVEVVQDTPLEEGWMNATHDMCACCQRNCKQRKAVQFYNCPQFILDRSTKVEKEEVTVEKVYLPAITDAAVTMTSAVA